MIVHISLLPGKTFEKVCRGNIRKRSTNLMFASCYHPMGRAGCSMEVRQKQAAGSK